MSLTIPQLLDMDFGYLSGDDLVQWCSPQILIKQYEVNNNALQKGCNTAYGEVASALRTKYNSSAELAKIQFTQAMATSQLTGAAVSGLLITNPGSNYISAPVISITGGGGAGATATAVLTNGAVTGFVITAPGAGYTSAPDVAFTGGAGADTREVVLVKLASILAVRNILGNAQSVSDKTMTDFMWCDKTLKDIRGGQANLVLPSTALYTTAQAAQVYPCPPAPCGPVGPGSIAEMITQNFGTLG